MNGAPPPKDGIITYVGNHLKGGCFNAAGFVKVGESKKKKRPLLQLSHERLPPVICPIEGLLNPNLQCFEDFNNHEN